MTDLLETHRWTRKIERNGSSREIRCLDCGAIVIWAPRETLEPIVGKVTRCPGRIVAESVPAPESLPPMAVLAPEIPKRAVPCSAGHESSVTCVYCEPAQ